MICNPPRPATGVSRARSVPAVSLGVFLGGLRAAGSGVSKTCPECPRSVKKVSRTLRGHSRDTFWTLRSPGPEGPQKHAEGHSRDTSGPKGLRDSYSRSGGVATLDAKSACCNGARTSCDVIDFRFFFCCQILVGKDHITFLSFFSLVVLFPRYFSCCELPWSFGVFSACSSF